MEWNGFKMVRKKATGFRLHSTVHCYPSLHFGQPTVAGAGRSNRRTITHSQRALYSVSAGRRSRAVELFVVQNVKFLHAGRKDAERDGGWGCGGVGPARLVGRMRNGGRQMEPDITLIGRGVEAGVEVRKDGEGVCGGGVREGGKG